MKKVVFLLMISVFFITGCSVKKADEVTDAEIFASEYAISKDNVFKYATIDEVMELLDNGTGIVFFGNSDKDSSSDIVKLFSALIEEKGIEEVYYYDPTVICDDVTEDYDTLIRLLGDNLSTNEEGTGYLSIPSVYFVKNGEIIGYNAAVFEIIDADDEDEWATFKVGLEEKYLELIDEYIGENSEDEEKNIN